MSIGAGCFYLLVTFMLPKLISRFTPPAITAVFLAGYALFTFPAWYGLLITSICFMLYFGMPPTEEDVIDAPAINRRGGPLFDIIGGVLFFISMILLAKSVFFK